MQNISSELQKNNAMHISPYQIAAEFQKHQAAIFNIIKLAENYNHAAILDNIKVTENNAKILHSIRKTFQRHLIRLHNAAGFDYNYTGIDRLIQKSKDNNISESNLQQIIREVYETQKIVLPKAPNKDQYKIIFDTIKVSRLLCAEFIKDPNSGYQEFIAAFGRSKIQIFGLVLEPFIIHFPFNAILPKLDETQKIILALFINPVVLDNLTPQIANAIRLTDLPMNDAMLIEFLNAIDRLSIPVSSSHLKEIHNTLNDFITSLPQSYKDIYLQNKSKIDAICKTTSKKNSTSIQELEQIFRFVMNDYCNEKIAKTYYSHSIAAKETKRANNVTIIKTIISFLEDDKEAFKKIDKMAVEGDQFLITKALRLLDRHYNLYQINFIFHFYKYFGTMLKTEFGFAMAKLFIKGADNRERMKRPDISLAQNNIRNFDFLFVEYLSEIGISPDYFSSQDITPYNDSDFIKHIEPLLPEISRIKFNANLMQLKYPDILLKEAFKIEMGPRIKWVYELTILKLCQKLKLIKNGQSHYETMRPIIFLKQALDLLVRNQKKFLYTDNSQVRDDIVRLLHNLDFLDNNWLKIITKEKQAMIETGVKQQDLP